MALTLKKRKGLIIPKTPSLVLPGILQEKYNHEKIIEEEIKKILEESICIKSRMAVKRVEFVPIYCRRSGEKEIGKIFLRQRTIKIEKVVDVDRIEACGITLVEFFDYIITNGAKEISNSGIALEFM